MSQLERHKTILNFHKSVSSKRFDTFEYLFELYHFNLNTINTECFYSPTQVANTFRSEGVDLEYMVKKVIDMDEENRDEPMHGRPFRLKLFYFSLQKSIYLHLYEENIPAQVKTSEDDGRIGIIFRFSLKDFLDIVLATQPALHAKMKKRCKSPAFKKAFAIEPDLLVLADLENLDHSLFAG